MQEKVDFVSAQETNANFTQENDKFDVVIPQAFWEKLFFKDINKRASDSNLPSLRLKALPKDDLEIRVWRGFGRSLLEGFILKRTADEWSATDLGWNVTEKGKNKREVKPFDKNLAVPKSGWNAAWQKLSELGILTLPDAEGISCNPLDNDGMSYVIEYNLDNSYRTYLYENPEDSKCQEAKKLLEIENYIRHEFYAPDAKVAY